MTAPIAPYQTPEAATPFLKWPGGKRWFVLKHIQMMPTSFNTYVEAFAGSASVFFALRPKQSILCDSNEELISTYRAIKWRPNQVDSALRRHAENHSDAYYYDVRAQRPTGLIEVAARMIYLNRTCFNGIYRVNKKGEFNVPRGSKDAVMLATDNFSAVARALRHSELISGDFSLAVNRASANDLVFADPPYTVQHNNNGFIKYNEKIFSWDDQIRLAMSLQAASRRGAMIVATNANHKSLRELYADLGFTCATTSRFSAISGTGSDRGQYEELIITNSCSER
ncbi:TPA: Dam family site-specific DNA-(adenine-N6)-methyltransferase [Stenotrophomonas maltophilia]|uniref:DNA adenine methylase n=1 Tax=Stenotrophomonas maltophilia TaxID=40324 RepID=UPI001E3B6A9F|nr:Dam family site-specific DNA-(adenine-N6)-methyltransferase [Stenotrophomonas maltophilia]MCD5963245.1 Dam family site-specific DNA-(adenine-N6)-methyltransferase [Stenotrophomonas maltophilia]HDS1523293.1 Dam family site-specific DNA-(adenine-N6)-methyltransferase [Stenotrophomonas maltophilia]HDS1657865.1 Dam family site-specific DNA-(adenine-N6)-methyltransferase [Stenotrophomonas maltophilia]HDS1670191.1 Dam family site-specific DNA-(adenine-N6)-methyltransferase [Stenotrophomonas maltop